MALTKLFMGLGGLSGMAGVALGALAAHALAARLDAAALQTLDTVSKYLLVHGLLLIAVAAWTRLEPDALMLRIAGLLVVAGIFCFCGGLSVSILGGLRAFGAAAPFGGTALMAGWLVLALFGMTKL
ncbi:MAG: DUF423 domain-containing protein [Gammaproteobacteria bacterium]